MLATRRNVIAGLCSILIDCCSGCHRGKPEPVTILLGDLSGQGQQMKVSLVWPWNGKRRKAAERLSRLTELSALTMRTQYAYGNVPRTGSVGYRLQALLHTRRWTPSMISKTQARQHSHSAGLLTPSSPS